MQKVITPKLLTVLAITALCFYLAFPTFQYFILVNRMSDPPTEEQKLARNAMLANPRVIKLGLDLQGGADFLLEVDRDRLQERSVENEAERLRRAFVEGQIDAAVTPMTEAVADMRVSVKLNNTRDLDLAVQQISDLPDFHLVPEGDVRAQLQAGELILRPDAAAFEGRIREATDGALRVVRKRVDEFGLTQPIVTRAGDSRISVQVPGEDNPERLRNTLLKTASLEFRMLHPAHDSEIISFIQGGAAGMVSGAGTGRALPELIQLETIPGTERIIKRLKSDIPGLPSGYDLRLGEFKEFDNATGAEDPSKTVDDLVYLVERNVPVGGAELRRAAVITDPTDFKNPIKVSIEFDSVGADTFGKITSENVGRRFAIILDDVVYSAPTIQTEILGGIATITGGFSQSEARDLSLVLKAGALPAPLKAISQNTVGPSLGADSIRDSGKAIVIGGILIIILMTTIYSSAGVIAVVAMFINLLLILAVLSLMSATLTLSGIGGILLTMGMAVDANILIYERLREEIDAGKPLRAAINTAFGRAFSVIFDSNVTSMLPALVLVLFEVVDGSVKGFWLAIAIGLIANLYTGIVVTRVLMEAVYTKYKTVSIGKIRFLKHVTIKWMSYRKIGIAFSGGLTAISIIYLLVVGPSFGIDFTGGVLSVIDVPKAEVRHGDLVKALEDDFVDARVIKVINQEGQWQVTVPQTANKAGETPTLDAIKETMLTRLKERVDPGVTVLSSSSIDPLIGGEFKVTAILCLLVASAVILAYLAIRFQWIFGAGAVLALVHDVFLSLALFKMLGHSLTIDIVSALLIILGYSVNDTIVVFDRIRESMHNRLSANLDDIFNSAINETLSRTTLTSGSTFLAILVMYFFGGSGLSDFALILLFGVGFGTYSSIFVASVLVYVYLRKTGRTTVIAARKATTRVQVTTRKTPEKAKA